MTNADVMSRRKGGAPRAAAPTPQAASALRGDALAAALFADLYAEKVRYCPQRGKWLIYDGVIWRTDELGKIYQLGIEAGRELVLSAARLLAQSAQAATDGERQALSASAKGLQRLGERVMSRSGLGAMLDIAATHPRIAVHQHNLDANDMLFACRSGVIDLATGVHRPGQPGDLLTRQGGAAYEGGWEDATCPSWDAFLQEVQPDPAVRTWLKMLIGYAMTGMTCEQIMPIFYGTGANGKGVFIETIKKVFGTYAMTTPFETFMEHKTDAIRSDLARLDGARLVVASEGAEGAKLDEGLVKMLTGEDEVTARFLHKDFFTYKPKYKIILVTNHRPVIYGSDHGIWRRIVLVPWPVTIPEERRDLRLRERLEAELPGILAWCLEGLARYLDAGSLRPLPRAIHDATMVYRNDSDIVGRWIDDCCIMAPDATAWASDIYSSYASWASAEGHRPLSAKSLADRLRERGLEPFKGSGGKRGWRGIAIRTF